MSSTMAPNSALELFREEFAEGVEAAISAREMQADPLEALLRLSSAFEKVADAELPQWLNIINELASRVDDGTDDLPAGLGEPVQVTTGVLADVAHLGPDFLGVNKRLGVAASTALGWCARAAADPETAKYVVHEHPGALTTALEILDDATAGLYE